MCGIIGYFNDKNAVKRCKQGLKIMQNRGLDGYGLAIKGKEFYARNLNALKYFDSNFENCLGHALHAIVSKVEQPIAGNKGVLTANCEIYNWKELARGYKVKAKNDTELLLELIECLGFEETLEELDGDYAIAYWVDNKIFLARDIMGVKPLFYSSKNGFAFASEGKVLENAFELNPRQILIYDISKNSIEFKRRNFFAVDVDNNRSFEKAEKEAFELLEKAVIKRVPKGKKLGLLFSGGIDSTALATILKRNKVKFECFISAMDDKTESKDMEYAKKIAKEMKLKLNIIKIKKAEAKQALSKIVNLIEDTQVTKVSVGMTMYFACKKAKERKIKVIFSGLGSEQVFGGYKRLRKANDLNKECMYYLRNVYERDTYRDDVIAMDNNIEMRVPFLDKKLIAFSLTLKNEYKADENTDKILLRSLAKKYLKLKAEYADRRKISAQYGSRTDNFLVKMTKKAGFKLKSEFLEKYYPKSNLKLGVLFSSGKDSVYATYIMKKQNYEISCLINIKSKNMDSYMFHTPNVEIAELQAEAMGIPLITAETEGNKEEELKDLYAVIKKAKDIYNIDGLVTGALRSNYQRERVEEICESLGLKAFSPLWNMEQDVEMTHIIDLGFEVLLSSIAAEGLDKSWLGRVLTINDVDKLIVLSKKVGLNIAGEGGEFESLVLFGPMFNKRIKILDSEIQMEAKNTGKFIVKRAILEKI